MVWYAHLFQNFPQFISIYTVEGFGIVNKAEVLLESSQTPQRWRGGEKGQGGRGGPERRLSLPLLEGHSSTRVGPRPIVSFNLNYLLKDTNLSKLREIAEDRGAWRATVHGVSKSQTQLSI